MREVNENLGTNISQKTVSRIVLEGKIGIPSKPGPVGAFSKVVYQSLKVAFMSYIKLEQVTCQKQSTMKTLGLRVNALVNRCGKMNRKGDELAKRLKSDVADEVEVNKPNTHELRRILWASYGILKVLFDQWEHTVISLGFGQLKLPGEDNIEEGRVVFFDGQKKRIINPS